MAPAAEMAAVAPTAAATAAAAALAMSAVLRADGQPQDPAGPSDRPACSPAASPRQPARRLSCEAVTPPNPAAAEALPCHAQMRSNLALGCHRPTCARQAAARQWRRRPLGSSGSRPPSLTMGGPHRQSSIGGPARSLQASQHRGLIAPPDSQVNATHLLVIRTNDARSTPTAGLTVSRQLAPRHVTASDRIHAAASVVTLCLSGADSATTGQRRTSTGKRRQMVRMYTDDDPLEPPEAPGFEERMLLVSQMKCQFSCFTKRM